MTKGYQKGTRRPDPRVNRDRGHRGPDGYQLSGGVPWPELHDGTAYTAAIVRVVYAAMPEEGGRLQWTEWRTPEGEFIENGKRFDKGGAAKPGDWFGVVSWDCADTPDRLPSRVKLTELLPEAP